MTPGSDLPRGSWNTKTIPPRLAQDLFWPVGGPQRAEKPQTSCPGCGSRQLTQRGSCAHCGTQRTSRPQRNIKYIDVSGMTISEALETMETYKRRLGDSMFQARIQGSWSH